MGGCMGQKVGSGQMTNLIKLELINIIWFSLKIYNLSRHPYLWVDGCVNGWAHVKPLKSNKSWPNRDNSIMDILEILLDILLKPPQPLMELFLQDICFVDNSVNILSVLLSDRIQFLVDSLTTKSKFNQTVLVIIFSTACPVTSIDQDEGVHMKTSRYYQYPSSSSFPSKLHGHFK